MKSQKTDVVHNNITTSYIKLDFQQNKGWKVPKKECCAAEKLKMRNLSPAKSPNYMASHTRRQYSLCFPPSQI